MSRPNSPEALPIVTKLSKAFSIHEDSSKMDTKSLKAASTGASNTTVTSNDSIPLVSSKLSNVQSGKYHAPLVTKTFKQELSNAKGVKESGDVSMESLIARLSEQQALLDKQKSSLSFVEHSASRGERSDSTTGSLLLTPATDALSNTPATEDSEEDKVTGSLDEVERLKKELENAKDRLARQEKELTQSRALHGTFDHIKPGPAITFPKNDRPERLTGAPAVSMSDQCGVGRQHVACHGQDDSKSDVSEFSHAGSMSRGHYPWMNQSAPGFNGSGWSQATNRSWLNRPMAPSLPPLIVPPLQQPQLRPFSGPSSPTSGPGGRFVNEVCQVNRRNPQNSRNGPNVFLNRGQGWDGFNNNGDMSPAVAMNPQIPHVGVFHAPAGYQPRPIGTPLSPTAAEFSGNNGGGPWNSTPASPGQTYVSPMEPLNYRRLLDRSVTCNWKYIVDKIVCNNDQQASIFLQQKLKVGTVEQKYEIVEAIVAQAYPLMVNRFGNFLVQRCFEHGTPEQVVAIANAIRGNTLSLSMDAFGCHVVQKAFDAVPEEYKAIMVHELLRRIPETVIHRYACHVWQKLFELRWSDSPPQIMKYVNEALRGMWHEVALGETGSLVVQNIFENCLEDDKRPCINEVLNSIDIVAHGQFGNWCIQHICEHGAPADRSRAIDHVLRYATEYSMDQFASKVVEKCLKIGGSEFLERYLERVCEGRPDRPRIPLIDISSDQYGNYLIQYILTHANAQHREVVASHIRGSKFGSRVGMLCSNPAYATRPGPGAGPSTNRFNNNGGTSSNRFNGQFR